MNNNFTLPSTSQPSRDLSKSLDIKRSLRYKILFIVFPLFAISFIFLTITIYFSSNNGITNIAKEFIGYQLKEVVEYSLSISGDIQEDKEIEVYDTVLTYAQKFPDKYLLIIPYNQEVLETSSETFSSRPGISTNDFKELYLYLSEQSKINEKDPSKYNSWIQYASVEKKDFVGLYIPNTSFQAWFALLIPRDIFYEPVRTILVYIIIIMFISMIVLTAMILSFVNFITRPLNTCVETIKDITDNMDFSKRVRIVYPDEIGVLGQYFNDMVQELEKSYNQIKNYAYQTVLAKQQEERIRFIFQKYVPSDVIDYVLNRTSSSVLIGNKQKISILFSDIRDFTTISEKLTPEDLVTSLNAYFTVMVSQVIDNKGMVDKFIGDALMAIYGAPISTETSSEEAVTSAISMIKMLEVFNDKQKELDRITFDIGIGINTGEAIVGNIGSEQKIEYTVIGDAVNLGSRLEGLTKSYKVPILISEFTKDDIKSDQFFYQNVDTVRVKGKKLPVVVFCPMLKEEMLKEEIDFYNTYHSAQEFYYKGLFQKAYESFLTLKDNIYNPKLVELYIDRCVRLIDSPPEVWDGVETWKTK